MGREVMEVREVFTIEGRGTVAYGTTNVYPARGEMTVMGKDGGFFSAICTGIGSFCIEYPEGAPRDIQIVFKDVSAKNIQPGDMIYFDRVSGLKRDA